MSIAARVMRWPSKAIGVAWPSLAVLAMAASNVGSINPKSTWAIPCATSTFVSFVARGCADDSLGFSRTLNAMA